VAKKKTSRRPNVSAETLERARAELRGEAKPSSTEPSTGGLVKYDNTPAAQKPKTARPGSGLATRRVPTAEELAAEYKYISGELRYVLILAGVLFAVIIIAALVMPSLIK